MKYKSALGFVLSLAMIVISFANFSVAHAATSISTCAALQNIGTTGLNGDYVLTGDIDCSSISNFSSIGTFTGTLDGQGHSITNFKMEALGTSYAAMFSHTNGAVIRNLTVSISGTTNVDWQLGYSSAVLVGDATNTVITNVAVTSTGVTIVSGSDNLGGLVGSTNNSIISYSHASVPLNGHYSIGGLVGSTSNGTIISKSYSNSQTASVSGNAGGLVGYNDSSTIVDSYSTSNTVSGVGAVTSFGGLVGVNNGSTALINRSYATGNINVWGGSTSIGGLVGSQTNSATTTNSFWDTSTTGYGSSAAGTAKNTGQMQTQGTFVSGWDFTNTWVIGGYPTLRAGDVTAPTTPTGFTAVATGANVHLAWTNPTDGDFVSVYVRKSTTASPSDVLTGTGLLSGSTNTSYDDNALADGTYYYSVIAIDTNGNYSIPARASVTVDTTPPSAPSVLTAPVTGSIVTLHWTNPTDPDFTTITIRRDTGGYPTISTGTGVIAGLIGSAYPNTVTLDGTYYYSVFAYDLTGNVSAAGHVTAVVDTVLPVLTAVTTVPAFTNSATPSYTFTSTKAGTISYGGSCSSATTVATIGSNTVTANTLADGTYSNCTITVTDSFNNVSAPLAISSFRVDTIAPVLTAGTEVQPAVSPFDAVYTFSTTETGSYSLAGCAGAVDSIAHTIRFSGLSAGTYTCSLFVTDAAGNVSNTLNLRPFTILLSHQTGTAPVVEVSSLGGKLGFTASKPTITASGVPETTLAFNADPKTVQGYAVSLDPSFKDSVIVSYKPVTSLPLPNVEGKYSVYMKYYSTTGTPTAMMKQTVAYTGGSKIAAASATSAPVAVIEPAATVSSVATTTPVQTAPKSSSVGGLSRNLRGQMSGDDVKWLQHFLNTHGYVVATSGNGSLGHESTYFGSRLTTVVIKYQKAKGITPANGVVGAATRAAIALDTQAQ